MAKSHDRTLLRSSKALTIAMEERSARVRVQGHTLRASPASPFRRKGRRRMTMQPQGRRSVPHKRAFPKVLPRCGVYSVVQVLLVAPECGCACGEREMAPERDGDSQWRTRRNDACFLLVQFYHVASELSRGKGVQMVRLAKGGNEGEDQPLLANC